MATQVRHAPKLETTAATVPPGIPEATPYRLSVRQFETMITRDVFSSDDRVELLGGLLFAVMAKHPPHDFAVSRLADLPREVVDPTAWCLREEKAIVLGRDWRPDPDVAIAAGPVDRYRNAQPRARDIGLLVEVSDASYRVDRGLKWRGYASARVPSYWIVNLATRAVEVFTRPTGRGDSARYRETTVHKPGDHVPVVLGSRPLGTIAVNEFLP